MGGTSEGKTPFSHKLELDIPAKVNFKGLAEHRRFNQSYPISPPDSHPIYYMKYENTYQNWKM
jgi:hypothetical protein